MTEYAYQRISRLDKQVDTLAKLPMEPKARATMVLVEAQIATAQALNEIAGAIDEVARKLDRIPR